MGGFVDRGLKYGPFGPNVTKDLKLIPGLISEKPCSSGLNATLALLNSRTLANDRLSYTVYVRALTMVVLWVIGSLNQRNRGGM